MFALCFVPQGLALDDTGRTVVVQALKSIKSARWSDAKTRIDSLGDKTASNIYEWFYLSESTHDIPFERFHAFIRANPDWPRLGKLKLRAEEAMTAPRSGVSDTNVVAWLREFSPQTPDGMDRFLVALVNEDGQAEAEKVLTEWWPKVRLTPDQQKRFLHRYPGLLGRESHIQRFNHVLYRGEYTNARALARMIGKGYPALAEARIGLAEGAPGVTTLVQAVPPHLHDDPGFMLERLRWRRKNDQDFGAIEILHKMPPAARIPNADDWWKERHIIARRLIEKKQFESAYLVVEKHQMKEGLSFAQAEFLAGWLALKTEKPWRAFEHFEALYHKTHTPISRSRGAYWAARASVALKHPDIAKMWYKAAARHQTTFYGQMAINALPPVERPAPEQLPKRSVESSHRFYQREMVQAASLLHKAGLRKETSEFLDALAQQIDEPQEYLSLAEFAEDIGHYHNAVKVAKKGLEKNIVLADQAFPSILQRMKNVKVEWALVHALIRQESQFDFDAESPVGAKGLMQVMPATAREVARKNGWSYSPALLTSDPNYNIRIGTSYIAQMLRQFDNSYPLALAAYNAGPGRVNQWITLFGDPRKGEIDMTDWIELIPIYETRNYVQRVMEGVYVYRLKFKGVQESVSIPIHAAAH